MTDFIEQYNKIRSGGVGFYRENRGLIEVSGSEAIQFLDGLITNDMKTLEDGNEMLAAFPTVKGRMAAVIGIRRIGEKYLIETEEATYKKVHDNLFRFTYAGDFHVNDLTEKYAAYRFFGDTTRIDEKVEDSLIIASHTFVPIENSSEFEAALKDKDFVEILDELYETLRIEEGIPKYGVDMDETTVVPEVGIENLISYQKGCYIGQEVIARIHFRGKVAKELRGLVFEDVLEPSALADNLVGKELTSPEGKNAGVVTSVTFSPKVEKSIALAFVRNAFLEEGTDLKAGDFSTKVQLPFNK